MMIDLTNLPQWKYAIVATKSRTGERVEGVTTWDGLSCLYYVRTVTGETKIVSDLDDITTFQRLN
jgi:hypothetical protein